MKFNKLIFISNLLYSYSFILIKPQISPNTKSYSKNKFLLDNDYDNLDDYYLETAEELFEKNKIKMKTNYKPRTPNQNSYNNDIYNNTLQLIIATGPAGTGKTLLPTQYAAKLLLETDAKIVLTRPLISVDEELGYLPGGINEKMHPWVIPIFDILGEFISPQKIEKLINEKRIEIVPLAFMRGRTFKNCFIIADELQNSSINQMLMLLTRLGENSKLIITGDISQCDNRENGLLDLIQRIDLFYDKKKNINFNEKLRYDNISMINMGIEDVQRSALISIILNIYNN
tara:strand:- start:553 stop:1413 length:861 start_codon:yes stop_codon:yes gene_type:complete